MRGDHYIFLLIKLDLLDLLIKSILLPRKKYTIYVILYESRLYETLDMSSSILYYDSIILKLEVYFIYIYRLLVIIEVVGIPKTSLRV